MPAVPVAATSAAATPTPSASGIPIPSSQATATLPPSPGAGATTHCVTSTGKAGTPRRRASPLSCPTRAPSPGPRTASRSPQRLSTDWIVACDKTGTHRVRAAAGEPEGHRRQRRQRHDPAGLNGTSTGSGSSTSTSPARARALGQPDRHDLQGRRLPDEQRPARPIRIRSPASSRSCSTASCSRRPSSRSASPARRRSAATSPQKSASRPGERPQVRRAAAGLHRVAGHRHLGHPRQGSRCNAGLLAGAIGLGLVIIYSFIYYRALGHRHHRLAGGLRPCWSTPASSCWA